MFNTIITENVTLPVFLICMAVALICGIIAAAAASYKSSVSKSFVISLVLLPMIVQTVITMVNGNVGTGVAVMGAFSLVRFRSVPGKAKDIAAIFLVMTAGLACAAGYVVIAVIFTVLVSAVMVILGCITFGHEKIMDMRITVPETLCFADAFDDLFQEYTRRHRLVKTKTTNMGSLYKLEYKIELKDKNKMQEFIDKLRCRNGNLEIMITDSEWSEEL